MFNLSLILRQLLRAGTPRVEKPRWHASSARLFSRAGRLGIGFTEAETRCPARNPERDHEAEHAAGRARNQLLAPQAANGVATGRCVEPRIAGCTSSLPCRKQSIRFGEMRRKSGRRFFPLMPQPTQASS